jgi:hypothetical protein
MMMLAKKYFSDNREWFFRAALGLVVLIVLAYVPAVTHITHPKFVIFFLIMVISAALVVVTIKSVSGYVGRKTGVMSMLLPARAGAKFWLAWGVSFPVSLSVSVLAVWVINTLLHHTTGVYIPNELFFGVAQPSAAQIWVGTRDFLFVGCLIHSVVFLGTLSVGSSENGFWKKAFVGVIGLAAAFILILGMPQWLGMPKDTTTGFPFFLEMKMFEWNDGANLWQTISWASEDLARTLEWLISVSLPVVLWVAAYFKFKELEVR